jgi:hypothetical protein
MTPVGVPRAPVEVDRDEAPLVLNTSRSQGLSRLVISLLRGFGVDETKHLEFPRFVSFNQRPSITGLRSSILTARSMTCQSLRVACQTILLHRLGEKAFGTGYIARSRTRRHDMHSQRGGISSKFGHQPC